ncbi:MAG: phosphate ABC transporter permease PstA [Cellulosilyticaceae bacterium]
MNQKVKDKITYGVLGLFALSCVAILLWIVIYIVMKGFAHVDLNLLMEPIVTTIYMVGLGLAMAAPIGIGAAVYLEEYANEGKLTEMVRFAIQCLTAIPSILFGLFGMMFFVVGLGFGYSLLAGALTVAMMILPTIVKTTEEALKTVPVSYREASLALGVTKIMTIIKVVLPSAVPGILAGVVLSTGRIVGETAAIYLTAGMVLRIPQSMMESGRTLSVHLYMLAKEGISLEQAYGTAIVLLVVVFVLNILTYMVAGRVAKKQDAKRS